MSSLPSHTLLLSSGTIRRIAIFRALQLGDLLVAVPAFRALRKRFPEAEITLIGLPWAASFVERYRHLFDRFVEFEGAPGINEVPFDPKRSQRFIEEQRRAHYDLAIQMHGSGQTSNPFVISLHARITVGYYEGERPHNLTLAAPYPHDQHEILRNLGLAKLFGCTDLSPQGEFPLFAEDYAEAADLLRPFWDNDRPVVSIHPGSRPPARRWPAEYFATVADQLACHYGARIVLTGGPGEEETVQAVVARMQSPALNLAGKTSLGGLGALIMASQLFISNDTGPAHLAHAINRPSITLFGPADYPRWAPLDGSLHLALRHPVPCSPCSHWECPIDHRCLRWLSPTRVIALAERFLHPSMQKIHAHLQRPAKAHYALVSTIVNEERSCNV